MMTIIRAQPTLRQHAVQTLRIALPLALAQLAQMAMGLTDTVLLGSLGGDALAAGGLGANLFFTFVIVLQGVLSSISVLIGQARGGGRDSEIPGIYWTGLLLAGLLALLAFTLLSFVEPLLRALGEPAPLAHSVGQYVGILRWAAPASMIGIGLMRSFLPAIGWQRIILSVTIVAAFINGFLNYGLIHGKWGLPRMGLLGSATASALTLWGSALLLLALVHLRPGLRRFVPPRAIEWPLLAEMLRIGWPVSITYAVEMTVFLTAGLLMGLFSTAALAAHQIVLNVASLTFMVPLALSQAANIRVAFWAGAERRDEARRSGWVAISLGAVFMAAMAALLLLAPRSIIAIFLDLGDPASAATVELAASLLAIAALFQVADGVQTIAAGSLRGLKDTLVPMILAAIGYWAIGFSVGCLLAFELHWDARGLWIGLALGLVTVAFLMTLRFHRSTLPRAA